MDAQISADLLGVYVPGVEADAVCEDPDADADWWSIRWWCSPMASAASNQAWAWSQSANFVAPVLVSMWEVAENRPVQGVFGDGDDFCHLS